MRVDPNQRFELAIAPSGALHLRNRAEGSGGAGGALAAGDGASAAARGRIAEAFERGAGHGLLHLGAVEMESPLPLGLAFYRELAAAFLSKLCAVPDLEDRRDAVRVPPPEDGVLGAMAAAAPPMAGGEYIDEDHLRAQWEAMESAFRDELARWDGSVQDWLRARSPVWNLVGRVCFHLAENPGDERHPFAFLATYATRVSLRAKVQHRPLAEAIQASSSGGDRDALLSLLVPVQRAAASSAVVAELLDSGALYRPMRWTARQAYALLQDVPALEAAGLIVRVPDWWNPRRPSRAAVTVTIGDEPAGFDADALLDFSVNVAIDGEPLTKDELREAMARADGLVKLRGRWVALDGERLAEVLDRWQQVERAMDDGLSFHEGMRMLATGGRGAGLMGKDDDDDDAWTDVVAGDWLASVLARLREPEARREATPGRGFKARLRPYQQVGVTWMRFATSLGLGVCLADDMGLGKTVQVLALLMNLRRTEKPGTHLLVVPTSLVANWQAEIERFAPALSVLVAHASSIASAELAALPAERVTAAELVITTYGTVHRLAWVKEIGWDLVILDEAQAIKNPRTKQARAIKALRSRRRIALTGTPIENRLGDLWSLFDFLDPGLLGSATAFSRFVKAMAGRESADYAPLRRLIGPYILRRLKTDRSIIDDLPDKTEVRAFCGLSKLQAALYQRGVQELSRALAAQGPDGGMARRGLVLSFLMRFKQVCNHPSQWLGDGGYKPADSGKFARLREICEAIAARQEKALVFTQFREITEPLAGFLAGVFGRPGLVLHGQTRARARQGLVDRFQGDPDTPFFVLSIKAGGTGLNLTAASHVIHFDRWWNPAVEDQATDRAFRIGQRRNVLVHKFVCRGTIEERIDALIEDKQRLSRQVLGSGSSEALLTEMSDGELMEFVSLDVGRASIGA